MDGTESHLPKSGLGSGIDRMWGRWYTAAHFGRRRSRAADEQVEAAP